MLWLGDTNLNSTVIQFADAENDDHMFAAFVRYLSG